MQTEDICWIHAVTRRHVYLRYLYKLSKLKTINLNFVNCGSQARHICAAIAPASSYIWPKAIMTAHTNLCSGRVYYLSWQSILPGQAKWNLPGFCPAPFRQWLEHYLSNTVWLQCPTKVLNTPNWVWWVSTYHKMTCTYQINDNLLPIVCDLLIKMPLQWSSLQCAHTSIPITHQTLYSVHAY